MEAVGSELRTGGGFHRRSAFRANAAGIAGQVVLAFSTVSSKDGPSIFPASANNCCTDQYRWQPKRQHDCTDIARALRPQARRIQNRDVPKEFPPGPGAANPTKPETCRGAVAQPVYVRGRDSVNAVVSLAPERPGPGWTVSIHQVASEQCRRIRPVEAHKPLVTHEGEIRATIETGCADGSQPEQDQQNDQPPTDSPQVSFAGRRRLLLCGTRSG